MYKFINNFLQINFYSFTLSFYKLSFLKFQNFTKISTITLYQPHNNTPKTTCSFVNKLIEKLLHFRGVQAEKHASIFDAKNLCARHF